MEKQVELNHESLSSWCDQLIGNFQKKQIVLLKGPVGAGKTYLVNVLLEKLHFSETQSPSYSLINHYESKSFPSIYHIDLYRLEDAEDIESTGFWDLFSQNQALIFIEWPEKINRDFLPLDWDQLTVEIGIPEEWKHAHLSSVVFFIKIIIVR